MSSFQHEASELRSDYTCYLLSIFDHDCIHKVIKGPKGVLPTSLYGGLCQYLGLGLHKK